MAVCGKVRVHRHRAKLREEGCSRLEVWIGRGPIEAIREVAKGKRIRVWEAVQEALQDYVSGNAQVEKQSK